MNKLVLFVLGLLFSTNIWADPCIAYLLFSVDEHEMVQHAVITNSHSEKEMQISEVSGMSINNAIDWIAMNVSDVKGYFLEIYCFKGSEVALYSYEKIDKKLELHKKVWLTDFRISEKDTIKLENTYMSWNTKDLKSYHGDIYEIYHGKKILFRDCDDSYLIFRKP